MHNKLKRIKYREIEGVELGRVDRPLIQLPVNHNTSTSTSTSTHIRLELQLQLQLQLELQLELQQTWSPLELSQNYLTNL